MLVSEEVEMKMHGKKIKLYKSLGYDIPMTKDRKGKHRVNIGTSIIVKIKDIPTKSHVEVDVVCDYCNKPFKVRYDAYNKQREKFEIDACGDCRIHKIKHANMDKYGVENCGELDFVKSKIALSMNDNSIRTSQQQRYIKTLVDEKYDSVLNHNDGKTTYNFNLDIAIPNEKIYIEYDGSGHWLNIKFKTKTEEEFNRCEIARYQMLKRNEWKMIKIISREDRLPSEDIIKSMIREGMGLLDNNFYCIYDIDKNYVKTDSGKCDYDFGETKRYR